MSDYKTWFEAFGDVSVDIHGLRENRAMTARFTLEEVYQMFKERMRAEAAHGAWVTWRGGERPEYREVEVELRNGDTLTLSDWQAEVWEETDEKQYSWLIDKAWQHLLGEHDIIAYFIIKVNASCV